MENKGYQETSILQVLFKPLFYIAALIAATIIVLKVEKLKPSDLGEYQEVFQKEVTIPRMSYYPLRKAAGTLSNEEVLFARTAWKYFENNYNEKTGLVAGVEGRDAVSMNDISSYLMGMMSAYEIGIIDSAVFHARMSKALASLEALPLYEGKLPNKLYHASTLQMLDADQKPSATGFGWSALEVGRFYSAVHKILHHYPMYSNDVKKITGRWQVNEMITDGYLYGRRTRPGTGPEKVQEGTLGYEEYCAKGLMMAGYDVTEAMLYTDFLRYTKVNDKEIAIDTRGSEKDPIPNYLVTDPFILDGLEYGWDLNSRELAYRLYKVQEERYRETGILTATGEDQVDKEPHYVYNCVYAGDKEWSCIDKNGKEAEDLRTISTKTAFAWYALFRDDYSDLLYHTVKSLSHPDKGWYAGKYEKDGRTNKVLSAVTNGTVLEALNYKRNGRLVAF